MSGADNKRGGVGGTRGRQGRDPPSLLLSLGAASRAGDLPPGERGVMLPDGPRFSGPRVHAGHGAETRTLRHWAADAGSC